MTIPYGYCHCGCGNRTLISPGTERGKGWVKGEPRRFIVGHNNVLRRVTHVVEDRGYETPCWVWPGSKNDKGYGRIGPNQAHRIYYERAKGPIPTGLELDHLCRVRACVNPDHLEPVTHQENMQRGYAVTQAAGAPGLPAHLRAARLAAGWSQSDLGAIVGVSRSLVGLWETGRSGIPAGRLTSLLQVLPQLAEGFGDGPREPREPVVYGGQRA